MAQRILPWAARGLHAALAVAFGLLLAWWLWRFLATPVVGVVGQERVDSAAALAAVSAAAPFGRAPASPTAAAPETVNLPDLKLRGVFAPVGRGPGFASFLVDGKESISVAVGAEIRPGVTLAEVFPHYVTIGYQGRKVRVDLEEKAAALLDSAGLTPRAGERPKVLTGDRRGAATPLAPPQPGQAPSAVPSGGAVPPAASAAATPGASPSPAPAGTSVPGTLMAPTPSGAPPQAMRQPPPQMAPQPAPQAFTPPPAAQSLPQRAGPVSATAQGAPPGAPHVSPQPGMSPSPAQMPGGTADPVEERSLPGPVTSGR